MSKYVSLFLVFFACARSAERKAGSTNACSEVDVNQGGTFTWTNSFSVAIIVSPAPGTTWFLGQSSVTIPASGSVQVAVAGTATLGTYDLSAIFDTSFGGNPCGTGGGNRGGNGGGTVIVKG